MTAAPQAVARLVEQAVEQGYPRHVTDPAVLRRVAALVAGPDAVSSYLRRRVRASAPRF